MRLARPQLATEITSKQCRVPSSWRWPGYHCQSAFLNDSCSALMEWRASCRNAPRAEKSAASGAQHHMMMGSVVSELLLKSGSALTRSRRHLRNEGQNPDRGFWRWRRRPTPDSIRATENEIYLCVRNALQWSRRTGGGVVPGIPVVAVVQSGRMKTSVTHLPQNSLRCEAESRQRTR